MSSVHASTKPLLGPKEEGHPEGYQRLAMLMGAYPALSICRRFMTLNAYTVLSLQAELLDLEEDLAVIAEQDRIPDHTPDGNEKTEFRFEFCKLRAALDDPIHGLQWSKVLEIRTKLTDYDQACARFRQLASSSPVNKGDLDGLRDWLKKKTGGNRFLSGIEEQPWMEKRYTPDLMSLLPEEQNKDALSRWVENRAIHIYHSVVGHRLHSPIVLPEAPDSPQPLYDYSSTTIANVVDAISILLASFLPAIPFFALYYIQDPIGKMGAIVGFTFLFIMVLRLVAKVRRTDCFTAATAFAAVQVVFLSIGPVMPQT